MIAFSIAEATAPAAITRGGLEELLQPLVILPPPIRVLRAMAAVVVCIESTGRYGLIAPACIETSSVAAALNVGDRHSARDSELPLLTAVLPSFVADDVPPVSTWIALINALRSSIASLTEAYLQLLMHAIKSERVAGVDGTQVASSPVEKAFAAIEGSSFAAAFINARLFAEEPLEIVLFIPTLVLLS
jgi:hypothetical protein